MRHPITQLFLIVALPLAALAQTGSESASPAATPPLETLLKLVPDDVALAVAIPDFARVAAGLRAFGTATGIQDLAEIDADTLFDELAVADLPDERWQQISKNGPFVFALTEPDAEPLLICTVSEPAGAPSDELIQLKGNVLIVAPDADVMQAVQNASGKFAQRFEEQAPATLKTHDLAIFFDMPSWATQIEQTISMVEMFSQMGVQMGAAAATTQAVQANLTMVNWVFKMLRTGLDESETVVVGVRFNADGAGLGKLVHFERSGKIAEYLGKVRKSDKDLLRGLAGERGLLVFAGEWMLPADVETFSEKMIEVVRAATSSQPADDTEWEKLTQQARKFYRNIPGYNGVMTFAADPPGIRAHGLYLSDSPQAVFDGFPALWKMSAPLMNSMAPGFSMEASDEMETIGSTKARVYRFKFDLDDEEMQHVLKRIYGESTALYVAPHPEGVAYTMGSAEVARRNLEKLLARKASPLSNDPLVANALKRLPPKPQMLVLLDLPGLIKWGMELVTAGFGEGPAPAVPPLELPKAPLPYVGFGLYLHEASCGAELFVPAETLKVIVKWSEGPPGDTTESEPY